MQCKKYCIRTVCMLHSFESAHCCLCGGWGNESLDLSV